MHGTNKQLTQLIRRKWRRYLSRLGTIPSIVSLLPAVVARHTCHIFLHLALGFWLLLSNTTSRTKFLRRMKTLLLPSFKLVVLSLLALATNATGGGAQAFKHSSSTSRCLVILAKVLTFSLCSSYGFHMSSPAGSARSTLVRCSRSEMSFLPKCGLPKWMQSY